MTSSYSCCSLLASNPGSYVLLIQVLLKPRTSEVSSLSSNLGLQELHSSSHGHLPFFFFSLPFPKTSPNANKHFIVGQTQELLGNSKQVYRLMKSFESP